MRRRQNLLLLSLGLILVVFTLVPVVLAQEEGEAKVDKSKNIEYYKFAALGCALGIGIAAGGAGIGQGIGTSRAVEGIARNPGAAGQIQTAMIIGLALIESLVIYTLVTVLILLFVNPFGL